MSADRTAMIKMASSLPKGSPERRLLLAALKVSESGPVNINLWKRSDEKGRAKILREQVERAMTIMSMVKIMAERSRIELPCPADTPQFSRLGGHHDLPLQ